MCIRDRHVLSREQNRITRAFVVLAGLDDGADELFRICIGISLRREDSLDCIQILVSRCV